MRAVRTRATLAPSTVQAVSRGEVVFKVKQARKPKTVALTSYGFTVVPLLMAWLADQGLTLADPRVEVISATEVTVWNGSTRP